jgi:MFS transporter, OPA family, glycerol-3-phosphate transporter
MYFQSFGAVSIVKVNAHWFHVRERGTFGGIFGILISLGIYFAYDWGKMIADAYTPQWIFFIPAAIIAVFFAIDWVFVRDTPKDAGLADIETGDASWDDHDGKRLGVLAVAKMMLTNPVILIIGAVELCSGFLRAAIMDWYYLYAKQTGIMEQFVPANWGVMQCSAGILGAVIAGMISDHVFGSRRGPMSAILYGVLVLGAAASFFALGTGALGPLVVLMMLAILGVHGMLSGTASMDFGGRKNVGLAVGIIDGLVYLGQGGQSILLGQLLPDRGPATADPQNWRAWPIAMIPVAMIGLALASRLWNARPKGKTAAAH